jgi:hypothetical protein
MYSIEHLPPLIPLGKQGEHNVSRMEIDVSAWAAEYPGLACTLTFQPPGGTALFPASGVTRTGNTVTWRVPRAATAEAGMGTLVVRGCMEGLEVRSALARTLVSAGQCAAGEAPDAVADWITEAATLRARLETQAQETAAAETARCVYEVWNAQKNYAAGNKVALAGRSFVWTKAEPSAAGLAPPAEGWLLTADRGNLYMAVFSIDALGRLVVAYSEEYEGPAFQINDNGELEVVS